MANKTVRQLPDLVIPSTGSITYGIEGSQSYQLVIDRIARLMITEYGLFNNPLNTSVMSSGNAEVILNGLNNAATAKLEISRINFDFISGYFDIDGGTFYDTYSNSSSYDGGVI
jgi:hypothetical protein